MISAQFTLEMCVAVRNREKNSLKPLNLGVQGRSSSSMLVPTESLSGVLVVISSKSVPICKRFYAKQVN